MSQSGAGPLPARDDHLGHRPGSVALFLLLAVATTLSGLQAIMVSCAAVRSLVGVMVAWAKDRTTTR